MTAITTSSATTSSVTGAISSLGVGSGIDATTIISKLMAVESIPLTDLQNADSSLKTQLSAFGQMQSLTATLQGAAQALINPGLWSGTAATSNNSAVVSATTASGAVPGTYSVAVQALAGTQTITSATSLPSSSSTLDTGTLTIQLGTWTGGPPATGFTAQAGSSPTTINITAGNTSLASIAQQINAAGAGVTATVINDANGARLSMSSTKTGAANGFKITATETVPSGTPSTGLSSLAFDATNSATPMQLNQSAANAKATVNGIAIESASNTINNVANGLNLTLSQVSATPTQITVSPDTASVNTAVTGFVNAFNGLAKYMSTETAYDPTSKTGGPLQGDATMMNIQWALRGVINQSSTASSAFSVLSDVGISMQKDGTLAVDSTKMTAALNNLPELQKLFMANGATPSASGFMTRFNTLTTSLLDVSGSIATRQQGLQTSIKQNEQQQSDMQLRLQQMQDNMTKQYQALDTTMAQMQALSSYITQQFSSTSTSSSSSA